MKTRHVLLGIMLILLACSVRTLAEEEKGNMVQGTIVETGFGKFKLQDLQDKKKVTRLFYVSRKSTIFKPNNWRPINGDKVSLTYIEVPKRKSTIAKVGTVTLVKAGPNTLRLKSPVAVEIAETGRSGYKVRIGKSRTLFKFASHRRTKVVPAGWIPAPGDKAVITFRIKPAMIFGLNYIVDKVEKTDPGDKSK